MQFATKAEKLRACVLLVRFLFVVLGGGLRLNPGGAFLGAATGTPVILCGFSRVRPKISRLEWTKWPERRLGTSVELSARAEPREGDGVRQV